MTSDEYFEIIKRVETETANKEARRLYAELKSLAHIISDEIMMSLYGFLRLWCHNRGFPSKNRESSTVSLRHYHVITGVSLPKSGNPPKVSLRDYDVITGDPSQKQNSLPKSGNPPKVSLTDYDVITGDSLPKSGNSQKFYWDIMIS